MRMCQAPQAKFNSNISGSKIILFNDLSLINEAASLLIAILNGFKKLLKLPANPSSS